MNNINISYHKTKIGKLIIASYDDRICKLGFYYKKNKVAIDDKVKKLLNAEFIECEDNIINVAKNQIDEYLDGKRKKFDLPLLLIGTEFQKRVWDQLKKIEYGYTVSYAEIAKKIGCEKAFRAVGLANSKNPLAIVIPCHRVIKSNGEIGGYAGGVDIKRKLIDLEGGSV